jgi:hypothetical protein
MPKVNEMPNNTLTSLTHSASIALKGIIDINTFSDSIELKKYKELLTDIRKIGKL